MSVFVALLTGGGDRPYAIGMAKSLCTAGVRVDFVGSDDLNVREVRELPGLTFLNLRGDQTSDAPWPRKVRRIALYYVRLLRYAVSAEPTIFHVLWNNKFQLVDRTAITLLYRALGKRVVLTVHNVNSAERDGGDSHLNRLTLKIQYSLVDHIFVHTEQMRSQLQRRFGVPSNKISTVPFGINDTIPITAMTQAQARRALGLSQRAMVVLFFGNIAPYKGLEYAVHAMSRLVERHPQAQLVIAGPVKRADGYWQRVRDAIESRGLRSHVVEVPRFVADDEVETYFKAADVLVLPYIHVFQSGVLFLGYHFGLPAIASDVGGLRDSVIDGVTGLVCAPADANALGAALETFFASRLFEEAELNRHRIRALMTARHSWVRVAEETCRVYRLFASPRQSETAARSAAADR